MAMEKVGPDSPSRSPARNDHSRASDQQGHRSREPGIIESVRPKDRRTALARFPVNPDIQHAALSAGGIQAPTGPVAEAAQGLHEIQLAMHPPAGLHAHHNPVTGPAASDHHGVQLAQGHDIPRHLVTQRLVASGLANPGFGGQIARGTGRAEPQAARASAERNFEGLDRNKALMLAALRENAPPDQRDVVRRDGDGRMHVDTEKALAIIADLVAAAPPAAEV